MEGSIPSVLMEALKRAYRARIDSILANKAALSLVTECKLRWGLGISDHVPIEVVMDVQRYGAEIKAPNMQATFPDVKWAAKTCKDKEKERGEAWQNAWVEVAWKFIKAEERQDIEEMHRLRCVASVWTLKIVTDTEGLKKYKHAEKRSSISTLGNIKSAMSCRCGEATDYGQAAKDE